MPETIDAFVWQRVQAPPFELVAWSLEPANAVPFARCERFASDAVGNVQSIVFGGRDDRVLWEVCFVDEDRLEELSRALAAAAQR